MSSIPEELYHEILVRVPVKSAFVCKCVCKTWYELISEPGFVKSHLDLTISKNTPNLMLDGSMDIGGNSYDFFYTIGHESIELLSSTDEFHTYASEIDYPFESDGYSVNLLMGSCDGVVCIWLSHLDREFCCLWNPASTEYREIPNAPGVFEPLHFTMSAFGYDCKNYDYKLVTGEDFDENDGNEDRSQIRVYSLRSNSWKHSRIVPYKFCGEYNEIGGVLFHGDLHWLAGGKDKYNKFLVSLDISQEKFEELELPKEPLENKHSFIAVGVSEGSLCVLVDVVKVCVEVWVMQDYGVRESWTKHCIVTHDRIIKCIFLRFICSFKNGEILFGVSGDLLLYDPKNGSVVEPNIPRPLRLYQSKFYFESLVSLNSGTYVGR